MRFRTHVRKEHQGRGGQGPYSDGMLELDDHVGQLLNELDELGIANDTFVLYTTDNGPHFNSWPDAGVTPFRSEKNTNWEGGFRVPAFARWPGKLPAGKALNEIVAHQDWLPALLALADEPNIQEKLRKGYTAGQKKFRVHVDGSSLLPYLTGESRHSPRESFFYINDDGQLVALRHGDWKLVFMEQRAKQLQCWMEPFVTLRIPKIFNLRRDPFERADESSNTYYDWLLDHAFVLVPAQAYVKQELQSLIEFPPRQKPASFNLDRVLTTLQDAAGEAMH
jgi:arylsulfatase A-like enzyme